MFPNLHFKLSLATLLVVTITLLAQLKQSESLPSIKSVFSCSKDYLVEYVKQKVISRSALIGSFNGKITIVKARYQAALNTGQLDGMSEEGKKNYYSQLMVEELRNLRDEIEAKKATGQVNNKSEELEDKEALSGCLDEGGNFSPDALHENWSPDEATMDAEMDDDLGQEAALMNELAELQRQAAQEAEMGWSMDPKTKAQLQMRAKEILAELLNNEVRMLAVTCVQAYLIGGPMGPVVSTVMTGVKSKVAEYIMHSVLDVLSSLMGRPITVGPAEAGAVAMEPTVAGAAAAGAPAVATA